MSSAFPTSSDLNAALDSLGRATAAGLEQARGRVESVINPLSDAIADAITSALDDKDSGMTRKTTMTSRARDRVERNFASLRWSYIDGLRLPLQQPIVWDARLFVSLYSLGNVVVHEVGGMELLRVFLVGLIWLPV